MCVHVIAYAWVSVGSSNSLLAWAWVAPDICVEVFLWLCKVCVFHSPCLLVWIYMVLPRPLCVCLCVWPATHESSPRWHGYSCISLCRFVYGACSWPCCMLRYGALEIQAGQITGQRKGGSQEPLRAEIALGREGGSTPPRKTVPSPDHLAIYFLCPRSIKAAKPGTQRNFSLGVTEEGVNEYK